MQSQKRKAYFAAERAEAKRLERERRNLPDPMPARDVSGKRIWLHYKPLRWERHP